MSKQSIIILATYVLTTLLWLGFVRSSHYAPTLEGNTFQYFLKPFLMGMSILPLLGGIFGLLNAKKWGGVKSVAGRAVTGLSLGMLAWSGGMAIWNYYLFFTQIEVPYPSLADLMFILSWPLWAYGMYQLSHVTGTKFGLRQNNGKFLLVVIPIVMAIVSYFLLIVVARGGFIDLESGGMKLFFDLFYPLGDLVLITETAVVYGLSRKFLGGKFKFPVMILFVGFISNYITDFIFSYTTTTETYFNGHIVDFFFTTTMFVLAFGITRMNPEV